MKRLSFVIGIVAFIGLEPILHAQNSLASEFLKKKEAINLLIKNQFLDEINNEFEFILTSDQNKTDTVLLKLVAVEGILNETKLIKINKNNILEYKNKNILFQRLVFYIPFENKEISATFNIGNECCYSLNDFSRILVKSNCDYQLFLTSFDYRGNILWCGKTLKFNLN